MLVDSHVHLDDHAIADRVAYALDEMQRCGIVGAVNCGSDITSSTNSVRLSETYSNIYAAVGVHPHSAKEWTSNTADDLRELSAHSHVVAMGEIGLDYHYNLSPPEVQREVYREQLELADSLGLPVVLHIREAYQDNLTILRDMRSYIRHGMLMHCYSGSREYAEELLREFDVHFAFGGAVTFKNYRGEALRAIPTDRLLLETDCPYMTPVPYRGQPNFPHMVTFVRDRVAEFLGQDPSEIERITTRNAAEFFGVDDWRVQ